MFLMPSLNLIGGMPCFAEKDYLVPLTKWRLDMFSNLLLLSLLGYVASTGNFSKTTQTANALNLILFIIIVSRILRSSVIGILQGSQLSATTAAFILWAIVASAVRIAGDDGRQKLPLALDMSAYS